MATKIKGNRHLCNAVHCHAYACWRREGDSNPRYGLKPYNGLANRRLQPLGHPSIKQPKNIYSALPPLPITQARQNASSHGINSSKSEGGALSTRPQCIPNPGLEVTNFAKQLQDPLRYQEFSG